MTISIHAPARGATPVSAVCGMVHHFNPRSRTGSDQCFDSRWMQFHISIHAPARGATAGYTAVF